MTQTSAQPEDNSPAPSSGRAWPAKTAQQLGTLIAVLRETGELIASGESLRTRDEHEDKTRKEAAETYAMASVRMRDILDDQTRWQAVDPADRLQEKLDEIEQAISQVKLQTLHNLQRPSLLMNAKVNFLQSHRIWVAYVGELHSNSLHGAGHTPAEALASFDSVYAQGFPKSPTPAPAAAPKTPKKNGKSKT